MVFKNNTHPTINSLVIILIYLKFKTQIKSGTKK